MGDQQLKPKKTPRKIVGGSSGSGRGSEVHSNISPPTTALSPSQAQTPNLLVPGWLSHGPLAFINNPFADLLKQQYMERLCLMGQEMHSMWPYGPGPFLPYLPPPHMSMPYPLSGPMPFYLQNASGIQHPNQNPNMPQPPQQQCPMNLQLGSNCLSIMPPGPTAANMITNPALSSSGYASSSSGARPKICGPATGPPTSQDPNNINIQIGLHYVNQSSPLNGSGMNETSSAIANMTLLNFGTTSVGSFSADIEQKACILESSSSLHSSPILLSSDSDLTSSTVASGGAGGDATNTSNSSTSSGNVTLSHAKFMELTRLAMYGSEIAEKLAYTHRNRPCFKKIDSLCARMKQDLIRPDGVLPNINSQGIGWAVKDFIFVFTRIINAWIIIKGYVHNTPEGLNKVKAALSSDFVSNFLAWQDITIHFVQSLIKSFVNLDNLVQSQKNLYQKSDNGTGGGARNSASTPIKLSPPVNSMMNDSFDFLNSSAEKIQPNDLNKNYLYTMVEDSEGSQRQATANGTYFKTGTYNPIKKDNLFADSESSLINNPPAPPVAIIPPPPQPMEPKVAEQQPLSTNTHTPIKQIFDDEFWTSSDLLSSTNSTSNSLDLDLPNWINYELTVISSHLTELSDNFDPNAPPLKLSDDLINDLNEMIKCLMAMKHAQWCIKRLFMRNYFPDFIAKYNNQVLDVETILFKCQLGGYGHIFEVVHDIKCLIYCGREFLQHNPNSELRQSITAFDEEIKKILIEPPFDIYNFNHIKGVPKEPLHNDLEI